MVKVGTAWIRCTPEHDEHAYVYQTALSYLVLCVLWWKIERPRILRVRADKDKCSPSSLGFGELRRGSLAHLIKRSLHNSHQTYNSKASEWRGAMSTYNLQPNPRKIWFSNRVYMRCFTGGVWHRCPELLAGDTTGQSVCWSVFCVAVGAQCVLCVHLSPCAMAEVGHALSVLRQEISIADEVLSAVNRCKRQDQRL